MLKYRHSVNVNPKDGMIDRQPGSCRPRSVRVSENTENVEALVLRQKNNTNMHRSICEIWRETGTHQLTVHRIIHRDLQLKCVKRRHAQELSEANSVACLTCCKQLLKTQWSCSRFHIVCGWKSVYHRTTIELAELHMPLAMKCGMICSRLSLTWLSASGDSDWGHACTGTTFWGLVMSLSDR